MHKEDFYIEADLVTVSKGDKGDKPTKGVDYYTDAEKQEFADMVQEQAKADIEQLTAESKADIIHEKEISIDAIESAYNSAITEIDNTIDTKVNTSVASIDSATTNAVSRIDSSRLSALRNISSTGEEERESITELVNEYKAWMEEESDDVLSTLHNTFNGYSGQLHAEMLAKKTEFDANADAKIQEINNINAGIVADIQDITDSVAEIQQKLDGKMEFYKVNLEGYAGNYYFTHTNDDGTKVNLDYSDLKEKYQDDKYFLFCEWRSVTFIPSLPPDYDPSYDSEVLEFSSTWNYMGEHRITTIKINSYGEIKADDYADDYLIADKTYVDDAIAEVNEKIDNLPSGGADLSNYYTKSQTDTKLSQKVSTDEYLSFRGDVAEGFEWDDQRIVALQRDSRKLDMFDYTPHDGEKVVRNASSSAEPSSRMMSVFSVVGKTEQESGATYENPKPIVSVERFTIRHEDSLGNLIEEVGITPPRPLNMTGDGRLEFIDGFSVYDGVWTYNNREYVIDKVTSYGETISVDTGDKWDLTTYIARQINCYFANGCMATTGYASLLTVNNSGWNGNSRLHISKENIASIEDARAKLIGKTAIIPMPVTETIPMDDETINRLRGLKYIPSTDRIIVTDNHGRDVSWIADYITKAEPMDDAHINSLIDAKIGDLDTALTSMADLYGGWLE